MSVQARKADSSRSFNNNNNMMQEEFKLCWQADIWAPDEVTFLVSFVWLVAFGILHVAALVLLLGLHS